VRRGRERRLDPRFKISGTTDCLDLVLIWQELWQGQEARQGKGSSQRLTGTFLNDVFGRQSSWFLVWKTPLAVLYTSTGVNAVKARQRPAKYASA